MQRSLYSGLSALLEAALTYLLLTVSPAPAQQLSHRLILKDGSYQLVTRYEVKGDRVRYLSAERDEWEEVPYSLVDWPATEKFEQERAAGVPPPEAAELDRELEAERKAEELKTPEVAPGLRLPDQGGIFVLDNFQSQPQLVELEQQGSELNKNTKGNIFRAAVNPIASAKQTIEVPGQHARIQAHVARPIIYVNTSDEQELEANPTAKQLQKSQQPEEPFDRFKIVRMQIKGDKRIVGDIKIAIYGKVSQEQKLVPASARQMTGGWAMVTPSQDLSPGEYAVVEMLGKEGINTYVWDFGVNPSAPANPTAWKPDFSTTQAKPNKPAELQKRDK